jgi:4-amino-4-deoxy-L-arabinose transferase-like glycosyltransferase
MRGRAWVAAVAVGAVAVAMLTTAVTSRFPPKTWEYSVIAANFLSGRGLEYEYLEGTVYRFYGPPVYPLLLAAVTWLTGREWITLVVQGMLYVGTALLIYGLARERFDRTEALIAGLMAATHPGNVFLTGQLHSQTVDVFSITLAFVLLLRVAPSTAAHQALLAGIMAGMAALCRGPIIPFVGLWGLWFLWKHRRSRGAIATTAIVAAGLMLMLAPVFARGYVLYGKYVPLRTDTGANLWYGNHRHASGTSYTLTTPPVPITLHLSGDLRARLAGVDEVQQHKILTTAALEFIRLEPGRALALFIKKIGYFLWFSPHSGVLYPPSWFRVYTVYYSGILTLGIVGLFVAMRSPGGRDAARLFLLLAAGLGLTQAFFYVEGRHRWEIEPLLLMFSGIGLVNCRRAIGARATWLGGTACAASHSGHETRRW